MSYDPDINRATVAARLAEIAKYPETAWIKTDPTGMHTLDIRVDMPGQHPRGGMWWRKLNLQHHLASLAC